MSTEPTVILKANPGRLDRCDLGCRFGTNVGGGNDADMVAFVDAEGKFKIKAPLGAAAMRNKNMQCCLPSYSLVSGWGGA